jgi:hypothetical protein
MPWSYKFPKPKGRSTCNKLPTDQFHVLHDSFWFHRRTEFCFQFGAAQDTERRPGCSASSGPTSSVDGAMAGQTRARVSVQAPWTQWPRAARAAEVFEGQRGEEAASRFSHSFVVSTSALLKLCTSIIIAVFLCAPSPPTLCGPWPLLAVGLGLLAWGLTPAAAGATPAINSAGQASQQRQEELSRKAREGNPPSTGDWSM